MRHQKKNLQLVGAKSKRSSLIRNLASSIILYEKVKTTKTRAERVKPLIEKLIHISKKENKMNAIRKLNTILYDKNVAKKLIEQTGPKYKNRTSGYTRITALGIRNGDNAPIVQIELVES